MVWHRLEQWWEQSRAGIPGLPPAFFLLSFHLGFWSHLSFSLLFSILLLFCDRSRQAPALILGVGRLILPALLRSLTLSGFIHTEEEEGGVCW